MRTTTTHDGQEPIADRTGSGRHRRRAPLVATLVVVAAVALVAAACVINGQWTATSPAPVVTSAPSFSGSRLLDVSCPTATFCMGVGEAKKFANGNGDIPIVQTWNGSTWSNIDFPITGALGSGLEQVTCASPTNCFILYNRWPSGPNAFHFAGRWDGTTWTIVPLDVDSSTSTIACTLGGSCVVAAESEGTLVWDGTSYHSFLPPDVSTPEVGPMACLSDTDCFSLSRSIPGADVHHWNGSSWSTSPLPPPPAGHQYRWSSTSCAGTICLAVGQVRNLTTGSTTPIALKWNGTSWAATPLPLTPAGQLISVSCGSASECVAIGTDLTGSPATTERAAIAWNGDQWYRAPDAPGSSGAVYSGVDCTYGAGACMAVGWQPPSATQTLLAARYTWTNP